jgi:Legume-like lectin family
LSIIYRTGDVFIADNLVRLSPAMDYQKGSIWAAKPNPHKEWMVEFSFTVFGRSALGGNGFALFYTKELGDSSPPDFYGRSATFTGMALVFDASDAPNNRFNPFIYVIENNGAKTAADFMHYSSPSVHLGACFREYRNAPTPVFGKLIYKDNILKVFNFMILV